jgi:endonuclease/exonuclease/phosphatase family metal-dependent hydrolase
MSKNLEIVSWNLEDKLNDPHLQTSILEVEPDIAVFPEAHPENTVLDAATTARFHNAGYDVYDKDYDDDDGRKDRHSLVVIAKPELVRAADPVYLVGRHAIRLTMHDGSEFMGVHLDDRRERRRLAQAATAVRSLGETAIVAGDLNATYREGKWPRVLRALKPFTYLLPASEPDPEREGSLGYKLGRPGSLAQRLTGMASGKTMESFRAANFIDADRKHVPTKTLGPIGVQIDHILYRGRVALERQTSVESVGNTSDHSRLRATLRVTL